MTTLYFNYERVTRKSICSKLRVIYPNYEDVFGKSYTLDFPFLVFLFYSCLKKRTPLVAKTYCADVIDLKLGYIENWWISNFNEPIKIR